MPQSIAADWLWTTTSILTSERSGSASQTTLHRIARVVGQTKAQGDAVTGGGTPYEAGLRSLRGAPLQQGGAPSEAALVEQHVMLLHRPPERHCPPTSAASASTRLRIRTRGRHIVCGRFARYSCPNAGPGSGAAHSADTPDYTTTNVFDSRAVLTEPSNASR